MRRNNAFTLIELLIVVAIIAILAAIAVPNFLEAQTRSKISRLKADMKTLATAFESYRVDSNNYPNIGTYGPYYLLWQPDESDAASPVLGHYLTSPVAYLTSIPIDVFNSRAFHAWNNKSKQMSSVVTSIPNSGLGYPGVFVQGQGIPWGLATGGTRFYWYVFQSAGPDLKWFSQGGPVTYDKYFYDPTNGTVSQGDIMYFSGWGFGTGFGAP